VHFKGATAIVTGGASGIGMALSTELVRRGARVLVADIDDSGASRVADELSRSIGGGGAASGTALDVTDPEAVSEAVGRFAAEHHGLDFMFNNAGIGVGGEVSHLSLAHWQRVVDVNLFGVIHGVSAAYPGMIERGRGHIVNTGSLSGLLPSPLLVPYSTTKHAVVGLSIGLRAEATNHGVRVSAVCPGVIETPLLDKGNPPDLPVAESSPDIRSMLTELVGTPYPADALAADVLDDVALNRPIIVAPRRAKAIWMAYRAFPRLLIDQTPKRVRPMIRGRAASRSSGDRNAGRPAFPSPGIESTQGDHHMRDRPGHR
jgi:NAD(P)-dependent dehydrogenase (short-subunit alcohol dehydrogenase family)